MFILPVGPVMLQAAWQATETRTEPATVRDNAELMCESELSGVVMLTRLAVVGAGVCCGPDTGGDGERADGVQLGLQVGRVDGAVAGSELGFTLGVNVGGELG